MDVSPEYVKMCEKAKEIQEDYFGRPYRNGDFIHCKQNEKTVVLYFNEHHGIAPEKYRRIETAIWLPRQDQLQEMVETQNAFILGVDCNCQKEWSLIGKFYYEARKAWRYYRDFTSMEQLWLAFVMKEKYGKAWNGEDWE